MYPKTNWSDILFYFFQGNVTHKDFSHQIDWCAELSYVQPKVYTAHVTKPLQYFFFFSVLVFIHKVEERHIHQLKPKDKAQLNPGSHYESPMDGLEITPHSCAVHMRFNVVQ